MRSSQGSDLDILQTALSPANLGVKKCSHTRLGQKCGRAQQPGSGEATALPSAISLAHITTAYRVRDESGIPLALPGQIVLGGSITKDQLDALEGALIAYA